MTCVLGVQLPRRGVKWKYFRCQRAQRPGDWWSFVSLNFARMDVAAAAALTQHSPNGMQSFVEEQNQINFHWPMKFYDFSFAFKFAFVVFFSPCFCVIKHSKAWRNVKQKKRSRSDWCKSRNHGENDCMKQLVYLASLWIVSVPLKGFPF